MHPKWLSFRYKLFHYHQVAQAAARRPSTRRMLDLGCGDGEYLLRFAHLPLQRAGLEISWPRLQTARKLGLDVLQASGTALPFPNAAFNLIYVAHVLHHIADYERLLAEMARCLSPDGAIFMVETVTDNPLLRLGRKLHPVWRGDEVEADWRFADLKQILQRAGFVIEEDGRYNLVFFLWEMLPLAFWPFEIFTPIFVYLDLFLARFFRKYAAHCYFVLRRNVGIGDWEIGD
ncbi:MAG: class I SAM-dependent methyltransferase [Anaerolineae bacterium]